MLGALRGFLLIAVLVSTSHAGASLPDIRPGDMILFRQAGTESGCTAGLVFRGSDQHLYLATAGHCMAGGLSKGDEAGEVWNSVGERIGAFVWFEVGKVAGGHRETALVRLDAGVDVEPSVLETGGPVGMLDSPPLPGTKLVLVGQGVSGLPARPGLVARPTHHPEVSEATLLNSFGDSGAPVLTCEGFAVGTNWTAGVEIHGLDTLPPERIPEPGQPSPIPMYDAAILRAGVALGIELELVSGGSFSSPFWC